MKIAKIAAILTVMTALIGIGAFVVQLDSRWAKAVDVKEIIEKHDTDVAQIMTQQQKMSERLDRKILEDRASDTQDRIWKLDDRYQTIENMPPTTKEEYRKLKVKLDQIYKQLDSYNNAQ